MPGTGWSRKHITVTMSTDEQDPSLNGIDSALPPMISIPCQRAMRPRAQRDPQRGSKPPGSDPHFYGTGVRTGEETPDPDQVCMVLFRVLIEQQSYSSANRSNTSSSMAFPVKSAP
jgi:hypothetical protein